MEIVIGPNFINECQAAGVTIGIGVASDGHITFPPDCPEEQRALVMQVLAAHDPTKPLRNPAVSTLDLMGKFTFPEFMAIAASAKTDPEVDYVRTMFLIPAITDRTDDRYIQGIHTLGAKGLLTPERVNFFLEY